MGLKDTLNRLLALGKIRNVKITKTVIEHDASQCENDCAVCRQVKQELEDFWKDW